MEQPSAPSGHRGMEYQAKAVGRPDGRSLGTPPTPAELFVAEMVADLAVGDTPSTKRMTPCPAAARRLVAGRGDGSSTAI